MTNENRPVHLAEHQASPKPVACRACGTWICSECSAKRPYASRFASIPQRCATCASTAGHMAPIIHRESRADDHDAAYRRSLADDAELRYPLELALTAKLDVNVQTSGPLPRVA